MPSRFRHQAAQISVLVVWLLSGWGFPANSSGAEPHPASMAPVDFTRDIRPILSHHCWSCHGPDEQARKAGLRLDSAASSIATLESGEPAINPEKLEDSQLLHRIASTDASEVMPPPSFKKPLTPQQIQLLQRWVQQGAKYSGHWSFTAPVRSAIPAVKDNSWPRGALDSFVLQRLEREGLKPNPAASRETLLRRVTFDLTGLPPSVPELEAFLSDGSPNAYERVVDRLLASPQYAEKMALQWLDAARYADTNGYNNDEERTMWPWRDWVIQAFAKNMPYDQFITEQLAGDLLPNPTLDQRVATGFNRNHVLTTEGGIIDEEYRVEYVADRVHTTSTVFLGLSFQCARCHDHKFDPMTQRDYYRFFAFFNNVSDKIVGYNKGGLAEPWVAVPTDDQTHERSVLDLSASISQGQLSKSVAIADVNALRWEKSLTDSQKQIVVPRTLKLHVAFDETEGAMAKLETRAKPEPEPLEVVAGKVHGKAQWKPGKVRGALQFDGQTSVDCGHAGAFEKEQRISFGAWIYPTSTAPSAVLSKMDEGQGTRGFDLIIEEGKPAVHLIHHWPDNGLKVIAKQAMSLNTWHHVLATWDGSGKAAGIKLYLDGKPQAVDVTNDTLRDSLATDQPLRIGQRTTSCGFQGMIDEVQFFETNLSAEEVKRLAEGQLLAPIADILAVPVAKRTPQQHQQLVQYYLDHIDAGVQALKREVAEIEEQKKKLEESFPRTMVMAELPQPRQTHILTRGQYDQPADKVDAGVASFLSSMSSDAPHNRLGLAQWLVSPQHPLTARVAVNRWWAGIFGVGLVETVEDFGTQGAYPSHPELLDFLATELIRQEWNPRAILKQIVMSATYQQSSAASAEQMAHDPQNRLLGRGSRYRFPAETVRDSALAAAGLLRERWGGPSVKPYQPAGLWEDVSVERRYKYVVDEGEGRYRRSMYTFWKRTCPPPGMTTFDAPDRETCLVRRARTNTPLQALVLLNDPTYVESSRHLAKRMMDTGELTPPQRLEQAFRLSLSRSPTSEEQSLLLELLEEARQKFAANPTSADKLLQLESAPQESGVSRIEWAGWTTLCSVILNLDEAVTRH